MGENNSKATDKGLISKSIQATPAAHSKKINDPIKKWAKELNRYFCKEDMQMANKHMKRQILNITHYHRNTNQNHNEVPSQAGQNVCYWDEMGREVGGGVQDEEYMYTHG